MTFFWQGSLESNYKYLVYKYKSYKVRHYFWPDVFRMRLRTPVFYQTIKSLTADQCNVVQNSRDHYHKFGKTQMLFFFVFFYVFGELKKKPINICVYHVHGFTQNLVFFVLVAWAVKALIKNTYLHIFSNCDYFSDWYWMIVCSQPRKFVVNHGWKY